MSYGLMIKKIRSCMIPAGSEKSIRSLAQKILLYKVYLALGAILLVSAVLRFSGITWGYFYPDESFYMNPVLRMCAGNLNSINIGEGWNIIEDWPNIFHLILYIILIISQHLGNTAITQDTVFFFGRWMSACISLLTVFLCYLIGKEIHSARVGLLSALLCGINNLAVLYAHFATMDSAVTLLFMLIIYFAIRLKKYPRKYVYLFLTGFIAGLSIWVKFTGGLVFVPIIIILISNSSISIGKRILEIISTLGLALIAFFLSCPFFFSSFNLISKKLNEYNLGFYGLFPKYAENGYQWYLTIGFPWEYGIVFSVLAVLAVLFGLYYSVRKKDAIILSFSITTFAYLVILCSFHTFMMRYMLLVTPILCLLSAVFVVEGVNAFIKVVNTPCVWKNRQLLFIVISLIIIIQPLFFTLAYDGILSRENVRVEAQQWIDTYIDQNTTINLGPSPIPSSWMLPPLTNHSRYVSQPLNPSDSSYDLIYVPMAQNLYLRYLHNPELYVNDDFFPYPPPSSDILEFYSTLYENRSANYTLIATFSQTPAFLGYSVNESGAPYEVTSVTHPEIRIYKRLSNSTKSMRIMKNNL